MKRGHELSVWIFELDGADLLFEEFIGDIGRDVEKRVSKTENGSFAAKRNRKDRRLKQKMPRGVINGAASDSQVWFLVFWEDKMWQTVLMAKIRIGECNSIRVLKSSFREKRLFWYLRWNFSCHNLWIGFKNLNSWRENKEIRTLTGIKINNNKFLWKCDNNILCVCEDSKCCWLTVNVFWSRNLLLLTWNRIKKRWRLVVIEFCSCVDMCGKQEEKEIERRKILLSDVNYGSVSNLKINCEGVGESECVTSLFCVCCQLKSRSKFSYRKKETKNKPREKVLSSSKTCWNNLCYFTLAHKHCEELADATHL